MVVDLAFELSYLLGEYLGEVEVKEYSFDPSSGKLCVKAIVSGEVREGCIEVKSCKGLSDQAKQARCISKTLSASEKLVKQLAEALKP